MVWETQRFTLANFGPPLASTLTKWHVAMSVFFSVLLYDTL